MSKTKNKAYIVLISIHGLIRKDNLELGRDADTGGQTKYVVELAQALGKHKDVEKVDLVTRHIVDKSVSKDYSQKHEALGKNSEIIRITDGCKGYLPKEHLWEYLDNFSDNLTTYLRKQERLPDLIHAHYADAGYVGCKISSLLGIPLVFTGHSLGRVKRRRLLASGINIEQINKRYNMLHRINAEEETLGMARRVITSTHQEIDAQYGLYDFYQPELMRVVPPGTDLKKFKPVTSRTSFKKILSDIDTFLDEPAKPCILAISRPDQRKNIQKLIQAYGESAELQKLANLVILAGNRDDIRDMDDGAQEVLTEMLLNIDSYDLYGKVAYPRHHNPEDVPRYYQFAAKYQGVFINPALTEPFGLTLIEAAACGVPIVATEDGGPIDIINNCQNGYLIDPLDSSDIQNKLLTILKFKKNWNTFSENGIKGVNRYYSWRAHVQRYMEDIKPIIENTEPVIHKNLVRRPMMFHERAIFSDLDQNLLGDKKALQPFIKLLKQNRKCASFGIATGRRIDSALKQLKHYEIPQPDVLITSVGTEIYYAPNLTLDKAWSEHINYLWMPKNIRKLLSDVPGLKLQDKTEQSQFKISYYIDQKKAPSLDEITRLLHKNDQTVNVMLSFGQFLDIIPIRANKGYAMRWVADKYEIPIEHILVAGGSGADEDMMRGNTLAVVVANRHEEELSDLVDHENIYFASKPFASGIMEAIEYYDFFQTCKIPVTAEELTDKEANLV